MSQGISQDLEHGGCQPTLGGPFSSPLPFPFPSLPFPSLDPSFPPPPPLEVGPLKSILNPSEPQQKLNLVHFSLKI